jgi:asparagine synthase (glutamine-hydrolysing)
VPQALVDRPKMGFGAPVEVWLQNELRDWAEALMSREALARHGLLNVEACRRLWEDFTQHGRGWNRVIWNILMFQAWHEAMRSVEAARPPLVAA